MNTEISKLSNALYQTIVDLKRTIMTIEASDKRQELLANSDALMGIWVDLIIADADINYDADESDIDSFL